MRLFFATKHLYIDLFLLLFVHINDIKSLHSPIISTVNHLVGQNYNGLYLLKNMIYLYPMFSKMVTRIGTLHREI